MKVHKYLVIDQNSEAMEDLANQNGTTYGICGFITCAIVQYLAKTEQFSPANIQHINETSMRPYIDSVMKKILTRRRFQLKKYYKIMSQADRKKYIKNWVANYEIADYIQNQVDHFKNKQVYFFRQAAYDHPELLKDVQFEEKERIMEEEQFKGHKFFYSTFGPYANHFKEQFEEVLRHADKTKPVIIATDILGHFYTTILSLGQIYILDSLDSFMNTRHDSQVVQCIEYLYKKSYLIKQQQSI